MSDSSTTTAPRRRIPELSVDARLLQQRLKIVPVGETVTYETLAAVIGRECRPQHKAYGALTTARARAQRDDGMVFDAVHRVGLKRLTDVEIVAGGAAVIERVRRAARKGTRRLLAVQNFDALPNEAKIKHNAYASMLGAMVSISTERKVKQLEKYVQNTQAALPLAKTLEVCKE